MGISWTLVKVPENKCVGSDELQWYHIVGFIVSITVFGCSLFAVLTIVKKLRDPFSDLHHILFIVVLEKLVFFFFTSLDRHWISD